MPKTDLDANGKKVSFASRRADRRVRRPSETLFNPNFSMKKLLSLLLLVFVGGGIFFIYLRREMFVEALIPGVLNGGFYRLFGHFPSRRKDAARWIGVHKYLISSI